MPYAAQFHAGLEDEFAFLRRTVDWFKARQDQKLVSLNLDERRKQKEADETFVKAAKADRVRLAALDYSHQEFWLGPPP